MLVRRGLGDPAAAREFMSSDGPLAPPEDLAGISEAADRLARALRQGERIAVHGDYDCDGISSTAILVSALRGRGGDVLPFLPSRFTEGYGVAVSTVETLADRGARVLVCVDCGTSALAALTRAVELGMDPVTLDHHLAGGHRPPGIIANPALGRPAEDLPAAAGVVHMLVRALAARVDGGGLAPDPDEAIDLVALATVADAVPLVGDNRRRVARGLRAMRERPGRASPRSAPPPASSRASSAPARWASPSPRASTPPGAWGTPTGRWSCCSRPIAPSPTRSAPSSGRSTPSAARWSARSSSGPSPRWRPSRTPSARPAWWWPRATAGTRAWWASWPRASPSASNGPRWCCRARATSPRGRAAASPAWTSTPWSRRPSGPLTRWGGHAGAIGLELPAAAIARFRDELMAAAEGARAAIARARVRTVDAVVGGRDLTLATAEALEGLAPFGRGNPPVRLVVPGVALESPTRVGQGQHLQVRIRSGGVHARAIGFRMGERAPGIDVAHRHDAIIELDVERWQGIVGPRVTLQALDPIAPLARRSARWAEAQEAHDAGCAQPDLRAMVSDPMPAPLEPPAPAGAPLGVRDRRGEGATLSAIAALAGADRGVVAVVADAARRREALESALDPERVGAEVVVLGGGRCDPDALRERLALARGVPSLTVLEYEDLALVEPPEGAHLVLIDPPASRAEAEWALHRAADRWLHLVWGAPEVAVALAASEERWELRPTVTALWIALRDGVPRAWGRELADVVLGDPALPRFPRVAARALAVLAEIGLVGIDDAGVRAAPSPERRELDSSAVYRAARARFAREEEFLGRAMTLDLQAGTSAIVAV